MLGLLLAFGVNLGIFTATYDQQARVDAQLTLGADVVATAPPGAVARARAHRSASRAFHGVAGVSAVDHSYAYVGPDLQDTFGIDPATLTRGDEPARLLLPRWQRRADARAAAHDAATASSSRRRRSPTTH